MINSSVMPTVVSCRINATVMMIAVNAANMIRQAA